MDATCQATDSTGIKAEGEGEWNARKHGGSGRRTWRKLHIGIDEETLEVRAVEVTSRNIGDAAMLLELLKKIPPDQDIGSATADGSHSVAALERIPPPQPRRDHDALHKASGAEPHGSGFRKTGRGTPNPRCLLNRYTAPDIPVTEPAG